MGRRRSTEQAEQGELFFDGELAEDREYRPVSVIEVQVSGPFFLRRLGASRRALGAFDRLFQAHDDFSVKGPAIDGRLAQQRRAQVWG